MKSGLPPAANVQTSMDSLSEVLEVLGEGDPNSVRMSARVLDERLTVLGRARAGVDYLLGRYILAAKRRRQHEAQGFGDLVSYLSNRLNLEPGKIKPRLMVADRLDRLPQLSREVATGRLSWSAARELVRVATAENEAAWLPRSR